MSEIERRYCGSGAPRVEKRCPAGQLPKICGYAATFGTRSQDLGGFVETVQRGAFASVLKRSKSGRPEDDIVALWNHDQNIILGRLSAGTLKLSEDERGLKYEITPPSWAAGYVESVARGDVNGSSFAFSVDKRSEVWSPSGSTGIPLREIREVSRLVEVSPTPFPAYLSSESKVASRCLELTNTPVSRAARELIKLRDCGTGRGGFKSGNKCAKGGDGRPALNEAEVARITEGKDHTFETSAYGADGRISAERAALHEKIIASIIPHNAKPPTGRAPILYVMGGGSGSGKSTMLNSGAVPLPPGTTHIDADAIKESIPEYGGLVAAGDKGAARFVHEESSAISKEAMDRSLKRGLDIILDSTGDGEYDKLVKKLEPARAAGYRIVGYYATNDLKLAQKLVESRYKTTGRFVPREAVEGIHRSVSQILPRLAKDGVFDHVELYDTNVKDNARKVFSAERGRAATVHDSKLWDDFLEKGK